MAFLRSTNTAVATVAPETFEEHLHRRVREGWTVVSDGPSGVQLRSKRPVRVGTRIMCGAAFVFFFVAIPAATVLLFLAAANHYIFTKTEVEFLARPK